MEAAPRLIDISEKRAARRDAAPLTGDLLARKGEAVSAARDVLNAQGTGPLPPAEPHEQPSPAKNGYAKIWIAIVAVLMVGGAVGAGYALRPAIEPTQAVAQSEPETASPQAAAVRETSGLATASGRSEANEGSKATVVAGTPPKTVAVAPVSSSDTPAAAVVAKTEVATPPATPISAVGSDVPVPPLPAVSKVSTVPAAPAASAPKAPPVSTEKASVPSAPPPPKAVPVVPEKTVLATAAPEKAISKPEPGSAPKVAAAPKAPKPAAIKPAPPARPQLAAKAPAAAVPVAKPPYLIQLVSVKSSAAANREWARLQKRFAGLFGNLEPSVQKAVIKKRGTFYRLRADGFANKRQAAAACRSLKAKGQGCLVIKR